MYEKENETKDSLTKEAHRTCAVVTVTQVNASTTIEAWHTVTQADACAIWGSACKHKHVLHLLYNTHRIFI
jgi:hypothetical protein